MSNTILVSQPKLSDKLVCPVGFATAVRVLVWLVSNIYAVGVAVDFGTRSGNTPSPVAICKAVIYAVRTGFSGVYIIVLVFQVLFLPLVLVQANAFELPDRRMDAPVYVLRRLQRTSLLHPSMIRAIHQHIH